MGRIHRFARGAEREKEVKLAKIRAETKRTVEISEVQ